MMGSSKILRFKQAIIAVTLLSAMIARAQVTTEPKEVNFCDVVAAPSQYYGQTLFVDVILWPSEHSLSLFGAACVPHEGYVVTTEAVLPDAWESLPNGKKLRGILKHRRPAKVTVVGVFERNGQWDGTRFRFIISEINSVSNYSARRSRPKLASDPPVARLRVSAGA